MSTEHPLILFNGSENTLSALQAESEMRQWALIPSADMLETLAHYICYLPDMVLLEDQPGAETATEIVHHLQSIQAPQIIVLTDTPEAWVATGLRSLPRDASAFSIMEAIHSSSQTGAAALPC